MNREQAREIQRKLRLINRKGAFFYIETTPDKIVKTYPVERIYMLGTDKEIWKLAWILGCGDFVEFAGIMPGNSVRGGRFKKMLVTESTRDKYIGEQITCLKGILLNGDEEDEFAEKIELKIATQETVGQKLYKQMQDWKKERAKRSKYYNDGENDIVETMIKPDCPDYDFIMS